MANEVKPNRPDKELVLEESGITLKMTYVVFNDILRYVGSIEDAMLSIMSNQDVRDLIIRRLLTDHKKPVEDITDLIPMNEVEVDIFELDDILSWTMEHIAYFFTRTATKMEESVSRVPGLKEKMKTSSDLSESGSTP